MRYLLTLGLLLWAVTASAFTINGKTYSTWNGVTLATWNGVTATSYVPLDVTDNFNRADGGLGANWATVTGLSAPRISSNTAKSIATGAESGALWVADTFAANQYSEIDSLSFAAGVEGDGVGLLVRGSTTAKVYYNMRIVFQTTGYDESENPILSPYLGIDGFALPGTAGADLTTGYFFIYDTPCPVDVSAMRLEIVGSTLTAKYKTTGSWITLWSGIPDVILSGGSPGIHSAGIYTVMDSWSGGNL